ncbi:GTP cyclohydrolase I, partial [Aerococcus sp. UMB8623]
QRTPSQHMEKQFTAEDSELVLVKDIPFHSMCEHHLLPFYGVGHIAYVPGADKVVGLSKLARILEDISLRLQLQEQITTEVAHT